MPFDGTKIVPKTVAAQMRDLFDNGKHWGRGAYYYEGHYCLQGAYMAVTTGYRGYDVIIPLVNMLSGTKWAIEKPALFALYNACIELFGVGASILSVNDGPGGYEKVIVPVLARMEELEMAKQEEIIDAL